MARFNVYKSAPGHQYLLDVQADLLSHLATRAVVPLLPLAKAPVPAKTLNPIFVIAGVQYSMVTQYLAAIRSREIGPHVVDLTNEASTIVSALDCLFQGV